MTLLQILHTIILGPLELLFDVVYAIALKITDNPGLSLIFLSLPYIIGFSISAIIADNSFIIGTFE